MGMTIWRWSATVAVMCAAVAALLLPFPATPSRSWMGMPAPSAPLAAATAESMQAAAGAHTAVRNYRTAQALDRWNTARAGADTTFARIDASVPAAVAAAARAIVAEQWAALGPRTTAAHAEVFVYVDSTSIPRVIRSDVKVRTLEPRALVDVAFALPEATDGERCVALVRMRGSSPAHIAALRRQSLVGVCGFFAAFGMPGSGVRAWLAATSYRFARRSDWAVARAPAIDATSLYGLSDAGGRCLTGQPAGCLDALAIGVAPNASVPAPSSRAGWVIDPGAPTYVGSVRARKPALGSAEDALLADAVRSVGADRFAQFWRSASRPDGAYLASTGTSLESWTRQWLTRTYGAVGERPSVRVPDVVWIAVVAPLLLVIAARPRERVLGEAR